MRLVLFCAILSLAMAAINPPRANAQNLSSRNFTGFLEVEPGVSLFANVDFGDVDKPIFVLLNGLTQDTEHWETDVPFLKSQRATIVRLDLALQGRSMVKIIDSNLNWSRPILRPLILKGGLWDQEPLFIETPVTAQARYVIEALSALKIQRKVILVGLSYGGGLALQIAADFPSLIESAILAAPYVFPLPGEDHLILDLVGKTREIYPQLKTVSDENMYDVVLRGLAIETYPLEEPEISKWRAPLQSYAVTELVRGIRHLDYSQLLSNLRVPLHLIIAGLDQYVPREPLNQFWNSVPAGYRGSSFEIQGSEHKINESVGPFLAAWSWILATQPNLLSSPGRFLGIPGQGVGREIGGSRNFSLPKTPIHQSPILPPPAASAALAEVSRDPAGALPTLLGAEDKSTQP